MRWSRRRKESNRENIAKNIESNLLTGVSEGQLVLAQLVEWGRSAGIITRQSQERYPGNANIRIREVSLTVPPHRVSAWKRPMQPWEGSERKTGRKMNEGRKRRASEERDEGHVVLTRWLNDDRQRKWLLMGQEMTSFHYKTRGKQRYQLIIMMITEYRRQHKRNQEEKKVK